MIFEDTPVDPNKYRSHAFVAMKPSSLRLRRKLPRLNIHPHHPHLMFHGPYSTRYAATVVFLPAIIGFGAVFGCAWYAQRLKGLW